MKHIIPLLFSSFVLARDPYNGLSPKAFKKSKVGQIFNCTKSKLISPSLRKNFKTLGFTKCSLPFGILVTADTSIDDDYLIESSKIIAEMLDMDRNGKIDNKKVYKNLKFNWKKGEKSFDRAESKAMLVFPARGKKYDSKMNQIRNICENGSNAKKCLPYDMLVHYEWIDGDDATGYDRKILVEEIHHLIQQFGYSQAYPEE